jgi:periodic tryptophan protein 2
LLKGAYDETTCLSWSSCSRILAVGAKDMTVRIYALDKFKNFSVCSLGGMTDPVVGAYFEADSLDCYTLSAGGQLAVWESSLDLGQLEPGERVKKKGKKVEKEEEDSVDEEAMGAAAGAETLEAAGEKAEQSARLIYKRGSRHFLRCSTWIKIILYMLFVCCLS